MRLLIVFTACSLMVAGCAGSQPVTESQPARLAVGTDSAKQMVLAERGRIWKDPASIQDARIGTAFVCRPNLMTTTFADLAKPATCICAELNARNAFGGYTGLKRTVVRFLHSGEIEPLDADAMGFADECKGLHPFPELNGRK